MVELPGGVRARAVVDYSLALRLLSSPHVSRDARRHWPGYRDGTRSVDGVIAAWVGTHNALNSYGEDHRRLRAPIAEALTRRRVEAMAPAIESIVDDALTDLHRASGVIDLVQAYALRIPHRVITTLLGVPPEHLPAFREASAGLFDTSASAEEVAGCMMQVLALLDQLVASKRAAPGDNLVSDLIRAADASSGALSDEELRDQLMLLIIAGTETTVHAIGTLVVHLMTHPRQYARLAAGALSWEGALEESLRHQPPIAGVPLRFAVRPFTDDETGESFAEGEEILIHLAAAGRDQAVHTAPAEYDIERATARRHLAFGYGPHFCPGAPLARAEVITAVSRWFRRFPHSRLAVDRSELRQVGSFISNGYREIPVLLADESPAN